MQLQLPPLAILVALALAACNAPEPEAEADTTAATRDAASGAMTETADPELLPPDAPLSSDEAAGFDMKGFAGTFAGTLPCASCPGIDTTLVLAADGTYQLAEAYREDPGPAVATEGTWSVEDEDSRIRLDPAGKQAEDRLLAIESPQRVVFLAPDGERAESGLDYGLERRAQ